MDQRSVLFTRRIVLSLGLWGLLAGFSGPVSAFFPQAPQESIVFEWREAALEVRLHCPVPDNQVAEGERLCRIAREEYERIKGLLMGAPFCLSRYDPYKRSNRKDADYYIVVDSLERMSGRLLVEFSVRARHTNPDRPRYVFEGNSLAPLTRERIEENLDLFARWRYEAEQMIRRDLERTRRLE